MYAQFFGTFLLSHNVVTKDQLLSALGKKSSQHMKLGTPRHYEGIYDCK